MILTKFKKLKFQSYKPGKYEIPKLKNIRKIIKLSANESALGTSSKVKAILRGKVSTSKYPDYTSKFLRKQISVKFNCNPNKIICGSGSDEIIQMLCQLFLRNGDQVIVPEFSFLMYRIYASISGAKVIFSKEKNFSFFAYFFNYIVNKNFVTFFSRKYNFRSRDRGIYPIHQKTKFWNNDLIAFT